MADWHLRAEKEKMVGAHTPKNESKNKKKTRTAVTRTREKRGRTRERPKRSRGKEWSKGRKRAQSAAADGAAGGSRRIMRGAHVKRAGKNGHTSSMLL